MFILCDLPCALKGLRRHTLVRSFFDAARPSCLVPSHIPVTNLLVLPPLSLRRRFSAFDKNPCWDISVFVSTIPPAWPARCFDCPRQEGHVRQELCRLLRHSTPRTPPDAAMFAAISVASPTLPSSSVIPSSASSSSFSSFQNGFHWNAWRTSSTLCIYDQKDSSRRTPMLDVHSGNIWNNNIIAVERFFRREGEKQSTFSGVGKAYCHTACLSVPRHLKLPSERAQAGEQRMRILVRCSSSEAIMENPSVKNVEHEGERNGNSEMNEKRAIMGEGKNGKETRNRALGLALYNSMTRQKEAFREKEEGKVGMYVCGVTVYDLSHIGHARVYVAFDVLFRLLQHLGYEVTYVRNFTDVDDKILRRASEAGEEPLHLSQRFAAEFLKDMESLNCLPPSFEPRVSENIPEIIQMILTILENGHGYVVEGGDVYFSVDTMPEYGALSGRKQEENRAGERVAIDARKKNPADFALWKGVKEGEGLWWESPWGRGRPGWHIECSAMSAKFLGSCFDIHGGGRDLLFPHHENELAQSRAACRDSHVSFWVHNGFVNIDSEKMSKSLGNFFTIREVLQRYHGMALRYFLLGTQYRAPINYSQRQLESASDRIFYLYQILADCEEVLEEQKRSAVLIEEEEEISAGNAKEGRGGRGGGVGGGKEQRQPSKEAEKMARELRGAFLEALLDDVHTSQAIAALSEPLKALNDLLHTKKGRKDKQRLGSISALKEAVLFGLRLVGLPASANYQQILHELKALALTRAGMSEEELAAKMEERTAARKEKNFARSDEIRDQLSSQGIMLMDGGDGTLWRPAAVSEGDD